MVMVAQPSNVDAVSISSSVPTTHEVAEERTKIEEVWRKLELAKMELGMLKTMLEEDLGLPQVNAIISNMGFSRKSRDRTRGVGGL